MQDKLEMLREKLRAMKSMTSEAREFFKDEIQALITEIQELSA